MPLSKRRLTQELAELQRDRIMEFTAKPVGDGRDLLYRWKATIKGPGDTPYEGGTFALTMHFPRDFPFSPPHVKFETPIYHPNINETGEICLDILKGEWAPSLTISKVLISLCCLLCDPNSDSALMLDIAHEYKTNREQYKNTAREWTQTHAIVIG
ncbi:Ubiquitin-conjugating enzyme E2 D4 [Globodera pallida]|nr:Ubiquitin-conjugating enzyme E2 D4 [Globodera pallida]